LIAYFIGNISAKKISKFVQCIRVIASQRWDVFLRHSVYRYACSTRYEALATCEWILLMAFLFTDAAWVLVLENMH